MVVVRTGLGVVEASFEGLIRLAVDAVIPWALNRISGLVLSRSRIILLAESRSRLATLAGASVASAWLFCR